MKIVLAPDSFKGTLPATRVCEAMAAGIRRAAPDAEIISLPMADGGEGTVAALLAAAGGERQELKVVGPLGTPVRAAWGLIDHGTTAVIEMAAASGLPLVPAAQRNPFLTTSYGTGQLIAAALDQGCRRLIIGLGGSATVDGGSGMAQALGARFAGAGAADYMNGAAIARVTAVDLSGLHPALPRSEIIIACDADNPLLGPEGAVMVYAPQKGAAAADLPRLEAHMSHFADVLEAETGKRVRDLPGAGAAGGMAAALMALTSARLRSGVELVMAASGFEKCIKGAGLIVTGEGRFDSQSLHGKAVSGVARAAARAGVPVLVLAGSVEDGLRIRRPDAEGGYFCGVSGLAAVQEISALIDGGISTSEAISRAAELIEEKTGQMLRRWLLRR